MLGGRAARRGKDACVCLCLRALSYVFARARACVRARALSCVFVRAFSCVCVCVRVRARVCAFVIVSVCLCVRAPFRMAREGGRAGTGRGAIQPTTAKTNAKSRITLKACAAQARAGVAWACVCARSRTSYRDATPCCAEDKGRSASVLNAPPAPDHADPIPGRWMAPAGVAWIWVDVAALPSRDKAAGPGSDQDAQVEGLAPHGKSGSTRFAGRLLAGDPSRPGPSTPLSWAAAACLLPFLSLHSYRTAPPPRIRGGEEARAWAAQGTEIACITTGIALRRALMMVLRGAII